LLGDDVDIRRVEFVGPKVGEELTNTQQWCHSTNSQSPLKLQPIPLNQILFARVRIYPR
jgi:hypothetical protein